MQDDQRSHARPRQQRGPELLGISAVPAIQIILTLTAAMILLAARSEDQKRAATRFTATIIRRNKVPGRVPISAGVAGAGRVVRLGSALGPRPWAPGTIDRTALRTYGSQQRSARRVARTRTSTPAAGSTCGTDRITSAFPWTGCTNSDVDRYADEIDDTRYLLAVLTHSDYPRTANYAVALEALIARR